MCKVRFKLFFDVITIFMRCGGVYSELVEANKWRDSAEGRGWGGGGGGDAKEVLGARVVVGDLFCLLFVFISLCT